MTLTMPQIIMMNHAAWVNSKRSEIRTQVNTEVTDERDRLDPIVYKGKRLSEMNSTETEHYMRS